MKCPNCDKILPITKPLKAVQDEVVCVYCHGIIPSEAIAWSDGKFHFTVLGYVVSSSCKVAPRVLMKEQTASVLDINKLRAKAIKIIRQEPNLRCVCGEFDIKDSDIAIELLAENQ
jgi:hypothetical protein